MEPGRDCASKNSTPRDNVACSQQLLLMAGATEKDVRVGSDSG